MMVCRTAPADVHVWIAASFACVVLASFGGAGHAAGADDAAFGSFHERSARVRAFLQRPGAKAPSGAVLCAKAIADVSPPGFDPARGLTFLGLRVVFDDERAIPKADSWAILPGTSLPVMERYDHSVVLQVDSSQAFKVARQLSGMQGVSDVVPKCRILLALDSKSCKPYPLPQAQGIRPDDPLFDELWGHALIGYRWDIAAATRPVNVAVFDTGIDCRHAELRRAFWPFAGGGTQQNATDPVCPPSAGYDYVDMDHDAGNCHADGSYCSDHGTVMAGIIAAATDNGVGVPGLAPNAQLTSYRILHTDQSVGPIDQAERAITDAHLSGARVLSFSIYSERPAMAQLCDELNKVSTGEDAALVTVMSGIAKQYLGHCRQTAPGPMYIAGVWLLQGKLWLYDDSDGGELYAPAQFVWSRNFENEPYRTTKGSSNAVAYVAGAAAQLWGTRAFASCSAQQLHRVLIEKATSVTPCGMPEPIKILNLGFLPAIADRTFENCAEAIAAALEE